MSMYGPAAIAAALQEIATGPGNMEDRNWVGPVFGRDQGAYDRAVGSRGHDEAIVLLGGAGFPVTLPPPEGIAVVTLAARIRRLGAGTAC